jgi:hypothetical protein
MNEHQKASKERYNATHYTQVKVSIRPEIAHAFKSTCLSSNVSMASILSHFMAEYADMKVKERDPSGPYATRRLRRQALTRIIAALGEIVAAEERSRDNTPENLQNTSRFEATEEYINTLYETLALLEQVY